ncbi:Morn repeat incomplete domain containing protein [Pandoravirus quercus]|uniref:Morn repeat incomplete domain containing protein n=1 Tax=Pandoravirus quercus TaxID=2107709 RepID=A0A2U7U9M8_9VIRU|nr:Morn repeat incomplete domain containing protein [Pandoravirus quercus]AVK75139.1 Morn repeat incomplete domain containing protein [Pandoravirus quercus]
MAYRVAPSSACADPADDVTTMPFLPPEMWWHVVGLLLATDQGVKDAARLGLTCRHLATTILDDEGTWAFCCRRDFGPERVALYAEREHFGVRWLCLYAAMAIRLDFGQSADTGEDRSAYGWVHSHEYRCGSFRGGKSHGYTLVATRLCFLGDSTSVIVMEYDSNADKQPNGWMSMRRLTGRFYLDLDMSIGRHAFCACQRCLQGTRETYNMPEPRDVVRARLATYRGGWRDHYPHGTGQATFTDGLVYEGNWENGLPHGRGALGDGVEREWFRGACVVRAQICACLNESTRKYCTGDCDAATAVAEWRYDGQVVPRPDRDWTDRGDMEAADILVRGGRMSDTALSVVWGAQRRPIPHGLGTVTYPYGTVVTAIWNGGVQERGTARMADGTLFDGRWCPRQSVGFGRIQWPSGTSTQCMTWRWDNLPAVKDYGDYPEAHGHALCRCPPTIPYDPITQQGPWYSRHTTLQLRNGDTVVARWVNMCSKVRGIHSFTFSPDCGDPVFAGTTISGCDWKCKSVPRKRRSYCPDDSIYWPSDRGSEAWAKFALYVRKRLIGWDDEAIAFWHTLHGPLSVYPPPP